MFSTSIVLLVLFLVGTVYYSVMCSSVKFTFVLGTFILGSNGALKSSVCFGHVGNQKSKELC